MKDFTFLGIVAMVYLLLVIFFQDISAAVPNNEHQQEDPINQIHADEQPNIQNSRQEPLSPNGSTITNPFVNMLQVSDPHTKNMLDAAYGSYHGDDQCRRKSACIMGNYMRDMPGRDLMFIFLGGYVPPQYSLFYDIFRNSALYGQNCDVYVCLAPNPIAPPVVKPLPRAVVY